MGGRGLDCTGSGWGQMIGSYERGDQLSGSKKCGEFHD